MFGTRQTHGKFSYSIASARAFRRARIRGGSFWKVSSLKNSLLAIFIFGHFRFPRFEIQTQRVETKRNTLFFHVFESKMSLFGFLPFFFLIMYDDG